MDTYILTGIWLDEVSTTLGVFSSLELAKNAYDKLPVKKHDVYVVSRAKLDTLEDPLEVWTDGALKESEG